MAMDLMITRMAFITATAMEPELLMSSRLPINVSSKMLNTDGQLIGVAIVLTKNLVVLTYQSFGTHAARLLVADVFYAAGCCGVRYWSLSRGFVPSSQGIQE